MISKIPESMLYLKINHYKKRSFDIYLPAVTSLLTICFPKLIGISDHIVVYGNLGLVQKITGLSQTLSGFYIAALAVVSTFNKPDMDKTMPSPAPTLIISQRGEDVKISLTRRRFLSLMFSFLTAESIILTVLTMLGDSVSHAVKISYPLTINHWLSTFFLFVIFFIFWQLLYCTFFGLYYLGHRIHQPDN